ncbi:homoserine dehydrogenase [Bacillus sp. BRMEA1]|uniref:homoserine dehydrogenase n=1 Tax=Neobacillus endophyticus TaxID=2738405 RepID=UPI001563F37B|nr:homoserine dehydrogenase [Neobacillus endophyticus]NRD78211.1 homoserine dehydrogenase [Neobacillus endophyticus]
MTVVKVAILGFGTVGEGVYRTIQSHAEELQAVIGKDVEVAAVLVKNKEKARDIHKDVLVTTNFEEIIQLPKLDIVVEAIVDREPTFTYLKRAIQRGCHIITANKEMFAHHGKELLELAEKKSVSVGFEATVAGGIPVIQTLRQLLQVNRISEIQGILNGTSNFILTEMREKKQTFTESLLQAQKNGYAEADPTNDVEGFDAFYKTMILSRIAFGEEPDWPEVERQGITSISSECIAAVEQVGLRFKHIATISKNGNQIIGSVKPVLVGKDHPFYHVEGVENAVNVFSDIVGRITLQGPGAGMFPTASAIIEDLVYVSLDHKVKRSFTQTTAPLSEQPEEQNLNCWLVQGIDKSLLYPQWKILSEPAEGFLIVEAAKKDLERLAKDHPTVCYFAILDGEFEIASDKKEAATVS